MSGSPEIGVDHEQLKPIPITEYIQDKETIVKTDIIASVFQFLQQLGVPDSDEVAIRLVEEGAAEGNKVWAKIQAPNVTEALSKMEIPR